MYYVYVLKSEKDGRRYIGSTAKLPQDRLEEHNANKGRFTRGHQPWKLWKVEKYTTKEEAQKREKFLKSEQGRRYLDSLEKYSGVV